MPCTGTLHEWQPKPGTPEQLIQDKALCACGHVEWASPFVDPDLREHKEYRVEVSWAEAGGQVKITIDTFDRLADAQEAARFALKAYEGPRLVVRIRERFVEDWSDRACYSRGQVLVQRQGDTVRFTTAPDDYDGFGTLTLATIPWGLAGEPRKQWRMLSIRPEHLQWQTDRMHSGLYPVLSPAEWHTMTHHVFADART